MGNDVHASQSAEVEDRAARDFSEVSLASKRWSSEINRGGASSAYFCLRNSVVAMEFTLEIGLHLRGSRSDVGR